MLCYTSDPMEDDLEITGQAIINLFLSSTHDDGVIFIYLKDIDEDGNITYITDGEFRVIHRKVSTEKPPYKILVPYHTYRSDDANPLIPGEIAEVKFGLHNTSVLLKKDHRLKIAIAGCDKDTFYKYPKKERPMIMISRNKNFASYIDLPIIRNKKEVN
jgi:putative CocE/NonD family hydrolase